MAAVFGSMPLASRIFLGAWDFEGAGALAAICLIAGVYFHIASRRFAAIPDPASLLERAGEHAFAGRDRRSLAVLTETIRLSPQLWQAYQYRGELYLRQPDLQAALADFSAAIRLAPNEPHLYLLRAQTYDFLGDESAAQQDRDAVAMIAGVPPIIEH
jgi:tetratricopeptide (TPR) repeat protein